VFFNSSEDQTLAGVILGDGSLTQSGSGVLTLTGLNTYKGDTTINQGALTISGQGWLGSGAYAGNIHNKGTLTYNSSASQTLSGIISGEGALTQSGSGMLTLAGVNTYTGETTIGQGTLAIASPGLLGGGAYAGNIHNSGIFIYNSSADQTLSGVISGSGGLTQNGPGTLTLSGGADTHPNDYSGGTTLNSGTLQMRSPGTMGSQFGPLTIKKDSTLDLGGTSQMVGAVLASGGTIQNGYLLGKSLVKIGSDDFTLSLDSIFSDKTIIQNGTLSIARSIKSSEVFIGAGATFDVSGSQGTWSFPTLDAAGVGTGSSAASIKGSSGGLVNLTTPTLNLYFLPTSASGDLAHPSLYMLQGTLNLRVANVMVYNNFGTAVGAGRYRIIQQATGDISCLPIALATVDVAVLGSSIVENAAASIDVNGGNVDLVVTLDDRQSGTFNVHGPNTQNIPVYQGDVVFSGQFVRGDPTYPTNGEIIAVTINGNTQTTQINDSTGDFSINYDTSTLPVSSSPYVVIYSYFGDSVLGPTNYAGTTLTVSRATPIITWSNPAPITYGSTLSSNQLNATANVPGSFSYTPTNGAILSSGTNLLAMTFTPTDTVDYTSATDTVSLVVIAPAPPVIQATGQAGSALTFTLDTLPDHAYELQSTTDVSLTNWITLSTTFSGTNSTITISQPIGSNPQQFYRVVLVLSND
jgi:autotransporter-associated beta strand protein